MTTEIYIERILESCAVAFIFVAAAVTGNPAPYQSDTSQRLCSIKGSVTDAVTDTGLRKAFVRLRASATGLTYPAVTDDAGSFVIEHVEPGSYVLEAEHQGFIESLVLHQDLKCSACSQVSGASDVPSWRRPLLTNI
jgi:Carboxypeptidase regulatory-like domain